MKTPPTDPRNETNDYVQRQTDQVRRRESELAELQAWKASAIAVESEWDAQAIAKLLGATLGQSCRKVINEKVPLLVSERDTLRAEVSRLREALKALRDDVEDNYLRHTSPIPPDEPTEQDLFVAGVIERADAALTAPAAPQAVDGKDSERLDWLERAELTDDPCCPLNDGKQWTFPYLVSGSGGFGGGVGEARFNSLRECIDAARAQNHETKE